MAADLLPLFPLEVVLFPGALLPLHIFERRYREMIGEAIERESEFGVVLVLDQKLTSTGCTAIVERLTKRYDDGRFDIETRGVSRFEVRAVDQSRAYLQGRVERFNDEPDPAPDAAQVTEVVARANQVAELQGITLPPDLGHSSSSLSFLIAGSLPLDLGFKQRLLVARSETERLVELEKHFAGLVGKLEQTRRAQRLASTNGYSN